MAKRDLPGLHFRACWFTPAFSKHAGRCCGGVQMHILVRRANVIEGALTLLDEVRRLHPDDFEWVSFTGVDYTIDKLLGTDAYRLGRHDAQSLLAAHAPARAAFMEQRRPFLLYE